MYLILSLLGFSLGVGLSIIWIGLPILIATFWFFAYVAQLERWLNDALLGVPISYTPRQMRGRVIARLGAYVRDPMTWWAGLYITVKIPFALLSSLLLLALFSVSLVLIAAPLILIFSRDAITVFEWQIDTPSKAFICSALGIGLLWLTGLQSNELAKLWARFARWTLKDRSSKPVKPTRLESVR